AMISLANQIVLISGASRGIGAAAALKFAEAGAAGVVINYRANQAAALQVAEQVRQAGAEPLPIQADVAQADEVERMLDQTIRQFGRLDVLVANAGVWPAAGRAITDLSHTQWQETININLNGVYYLCQAAAKLFV